MERCSYVLIISSTGSKKEIWEVFGMRESHLEIIPIHNKVLAKAPVLPETPSLIRIMLIRNKTKQNTFLRIKAYAISAVQQRQRKFC